ncbi:uncharacterized protein I303_108005 [Kwoniella dejecticola CBS 10117]|uniref:Transmembrane protein 188 n=1 Tax=Kwoniella dejecticola CBS 10117 TaxID=1296121 RepID=A0A1A5ZW97_9TREE|nr:uncharacterized protein I303_07996 [Kwoniella dejecticola CBS 10117]OBR82082.1 hypothetical protein I303_07996 [Kwoniella dejecticola CBS 10117]
MSVRNNPTPSSSGTASPARPHPLAPYHPPADTATYRDLLLFEERLKSNAEMLKKRRQRYSVFLYTFIAVAIFMAYKLFITPPKSNLRMRALQASMAVVSVTLVLFFASGMYEEKIKYAHSYINHSNKALRPLNMHLNMRRAKPSLLSYIPYLRHLRSSSPQTSATPPIQPNPPSARPFLGGRSTGNNPTARKVSNSTNVMATIPPSSNPRGELIFSSRVDRGFREGYERYRSAFERRREEKQKEESRLNLNSTQWLSWTTSSHKKGIKGGNGNRRNGSPSPSPIPSSRNTPTPTPPLSRKQTPPPQPANSGLGVESNTGKTTRAGTALGRRRSPSPGSSGLRNSVSLESESEGRERSESYSFVLNQNHNQNRHRDQPQGRPGIPAAG